MAAKINSLPEGRIVSAYLDGSPLLRVAAAYGTTRIVVTRILAEHGVEPRSLKEAQQLRYQRQSPEKNKRDVLAANIACRGRKVGEDVLARRALHIQANWGLTDGEKEWQSRLVAWGYRPVPLMAVHIFNIDLALPDLRVAIEVQNSWHHSKRKEAQDLKKIDHLEQAGWAVLYVTARDLTGLASRSLCSVLRLIASQVQGRQA